jgi:hypothetical protein
MSRRLAAVLTTVALLGAAACSGSSGNDKADTGPTQPGSASPTPSGSYTSPPATLPVGDVELSTEPPPWLAPATVDNGAQSASFVQAAGLPWAEEMLAVHYHAHLDIIIDGEHVTVPPYLGYVIENGNASLAPLHTHDDSGVIHIENDVPAKFLLGQVFVEWGVRFTADCLGAACAGSGKELAVFVNGKPYDGDPTRLLLASHQEIAVIFGDAGQLPEPPSSYDFPEKL